MNRNAILLIADIAPLVFSLRTSLQTRGYTVVVVDSAEDAMRQLQTNPQLGLVIYDTAVRKIDDLVVRMVLRLASTNNKGTMPVLKVITLVSPGDSTSRDDCNIVGRARLCTNDNVLLKPVEMDELLRRVRSLIGEAMPLPSNQESAAPSLIIPAAGPADHTTESSIERQN